MAGRPHALIVVLASVLLARPRRLLLAPKARRHVWTCSTEDWQDTRG